MNLEWKVIRIQCIVWQRPCRPVHVSVVRDPALSSVDLMVLQVSRSRFSKRQIAAEMLDRQLDPLGLIIFASYLGGSMTAK